MYGKQDIRDAVYAVVLVFSILTMFSYAITYSIDNSNPVRSEPIEPVRSKPILVEPIKLIEPVKPILFTDIFNPKGILILRGKWQSVSIRPERIVHGVSIRFRVINANKDIYAIKDIVGNYFQEYDIEWNVKTTRYQGTYNSTYSETNMQFILTK